MKTLKSIYFHIGFFYHSVFAFGPKIALDNLLIVFTKWFIGAKRMQISYRKNQSKKK